MNKSSIKIIAVAVLLTLVGAFLFFNGKNKKTEAQDVSLNQGPVVSSVMPTDPATLLAAHSPSMGPDFAPVTLVEFLDPECEACKAMNPIVKKIMKEYDGKIRLVVRYMPFHGNSIYAATILEAAREQGKYWETLNLLFEEQDTWASHHDPKPEMIFEIIKPLKLDHAKIEAHLKAQSFSSQIQKDKEDGQLLGVRGTPSFFVNGMMLEELGYEPLKAAIEKRLAITK